MRHLKKIDPRIHSVIRKEDQRQEQCLEMIASENYVSKAVMEAVGTSLTNKYAEGKPKKRYYGGCDIVDEAEILAIERAKELFGCEHVNVQPHSGSQANQAVYLALLKPGDTIMSMSLDHGGHLSHGSPVNLTGKYYNIVNYGVDETTEVIDYDHVKRVAEEHKPKLIICGASAYPRKIDFWKFRYIADDVGAYLLADIAHIAGLVVADYHQSPVHLADFITTTTHKTLRGPRGAIAMCNKVPDKAVKTTLDAMLDKAVFPGLQGGPLMHVIAGKAVAFHEALQPEFKIYQYNVLRNAEELAECLENKGLRLVSGGTDNHLMLVDVKAIDKRLTGKIAESALEKVGLATNKNMRPKDEESPFITSAIRLGTPALTTRGLETRHMSIIADIIYDTLMNIEPSNKKEFKFKDHKTTKRIRSLVKDICRAFPVYKRRSPRGWLSYRTGYD